MTSIETFREKWGTGGASLLIRLAAFRRGEKEAAVLREIAADLDALLKLDDGSIVATQQTRDALGSMVE